MNRLHDHQRRNRVNLVRRHAHAVHGGVIDDLAVAEACSVLEADVKEAVLELVADHAEATSQIGCSGKRCGVLRPQTSMD